MMVIFKNTFSFTILIFVLLVVLFCTFTIFSMKEIVNVFEREDVLREI